MREGRALHEAEAIHEGADHWVLKEAEAGANALDLCRQHGNSEQIFYRWKAKYAGLDVREVQRLRHLQDENRRLKQIVADLTLDNRALKGLLGKKF